MSIHNILSSFPKPVTPLLPEYQKILETHYAENRNFTTPMSKLARFVESWMHVKVAADTKVLKPNSFRTLEIGAGTLNHIPFEPPSLDYDIVEPRLYLIESSPNKSRVQNVFTDIFDVPAANKYDRIISIATLEHLSRLPDIVAKAAELLKDGGDFRSAIPSEGGLLWKISWMISTGVEFRIRHRLDYSVIMKHLHVNDVHEIAQVSRYFYKDVSRSGLGIGTQFSLYQFFTCKSPDLQRCRQWLENKS